MADKKDDKVDAKAADAKEEKVEAKKKAPAKKAEKADAKAESKDAEKAAPKKAAAKKKAPAKTAKEKADEKAAKAEKAAAVVVEKKPAARGAAKAEDSVSDLKDLKDLTGAPAVTPDVAAGGSDDAQQNAPIERVVEIDEHGRAYGTGRRKDAVARVWIKRGSGKVVVNGRDQTDYFGRNTHRLILNQPFLIVNSVGHFDVMCTVTGGGLSGQAGAVRHGISRALEKFDPANRPELKKAGMLTRDARIVERKKVGKHKARRTKQWAKR